MSANFKLYILFKDRVGIVADISSLMARKNLNIVSMEVERRDDKAKVYVEIEERGPSMDQAEIFEMLGEIPDLLEIRFIETLPQETRENRFQVVLDNIRDGVISIDPEGKITTINKVARRVLNCEGDEVIGKDILELDLSDYSILECLRGKKFSNVKKEIINEKGRFQYFATCRPITDSANRIVGAVEIGKDMQEIKMLAQSISQPSVVTFSDFMGKSPTIREAILFAQKIARTDSIVSIRGESGTGKEVFARAIHAASDRKGPFTPINCAALPENLLESELFGYVAGAFTGAKKEGKPGLFELADRGTILLDEIGEMPVNLQAKILRVIQEKSVRRIGGAREIPVNARVITATNKNLEQMLKEKMFREDLYYRINVLPIHIPPLRERAEDIPLLVDHFLFQLTSRLGKEPLSLTREALEKLCRHDWPGNVRELKNVIERAAILCEMDEIDIDCIRFSFEIGKCSAGVKSQFIPAAHEDQPLQATLGAYEKELICQTLNKCSSIRKAAKYLGLSHTALLNKLKKHKITMEAK